MTKKERERLKVLEQIKMGKITYSEGSEQLNLSERQLYRSMVRYLK